MKLTVVLNWSRAFSIPAAMGVLGLFSGCDAPSGKENLETESPDSPVVPITLRPAGTLESSIEEGEEIEDSPKQQSMFGSAEERKVMGAVSAILGESIELNQPILNPGKDIEEFELLEILIELEDRFDVEIDEEAIERASGSRFNEVQKRLTPRLLIDIVAEASRDGE